MLEYRSILNIGLATLKRKYPSTRRAKTLEPVHTSLVFRSVGSYNAESKGPAARGAAMLFFSVRR
jgi:hypothetical protein